MNETKSAQDYGIVLFDGVCNLCSGTVQFLIHRDPRRALRYASLQSEFARDLLQQTAVSATDLETIVYIEHNQVYQRSTALLRILRRLQFPWPLLFLLILIPAPVRDCAYRWIARNRYQWFGQKDSCWIPTPELRSLFLDG